MILLYKNLTVFIDRSEWHDLVVAEVLVMDPPWQDSFVNSDGLRLQGVDSAGWAVKLYKLRQLQNGEEALRKPLV